MLTSPVLRSKCAVFGLSQWENEGQASRPIAIIKTGIASSIAGW